MYRAVIVLCVYVLVHDVSLWQRALYYCELILIISDGRLMLRRELLKVDIVTLTVTVCVSVLLDIY